MEGHVNISFDNPLNPSRISGFQPFLTTAFDVNVPDKTESSAFNKVRLWRVGQLNDTECKGLDGIDSSELTSYK